MKKAFGMILNFGALLLTGLIVVTFVYIQYFICVNLVAGNHIEISRKIIFYALFESSPVVFLLMIPCLIIYKVRHLQNPVATAITFSILCILIWIVLLPSGQLLKQKFYSNNNISFTNENTLSHGYFRTIEDRYYYFIKDEDPKTKTAETILVHDSMHPGQSGVIETISTKANSAISNFADPYKDPLIKQNMSDLPVSVFDLINIFKKSVFRSWKNGFISWLCFCSLGFLMASAYSLIKISSWRIVNFTYIIMVQFGAIILNTFYYLSKFFNLRLFLNKLVYGADYSRFIFFQEKLIQLPLVMINILLGILIIICGSVITAIKHKK